MFEMNIRVAARQACGDQFSGCVRAKIRAHAGRDGMTLKGLGSDPDLYPWRKRPTLEVCERLVWAGNNNF